MQSVSEVASLPLATEVGRFELRAYAGGSGCVYLAMCFGEVRRTAAVLTRIHSECVTGDVFGSLRCDCGNQLRTTMKTIAREKRGILLYVIGHEGRGIGLLNKLRAYELQDGGHDTVDGNLELGLPVDARDYREAAEVLESLEVRSVRLLTNNPDKISALARHGVRVEERVPVHIAPNWRQLPYLQTKRSRMQHAAPQCAVFDEPLPATDDVVRLVGNPTPRETRPYVVLKYAQTLDGRIAARNGDSKWISGEAERRLTHALRAACDAVLVGAGTVAADDPLLTVRLVPGPNPSRVVLDRTLRVAAEANVLNDDARTIIVTGTEADPSRVRSLSEQATVVSVPAGSSGIDPREALRRLQGLGIDLLLVEGGSRVITSFLRAGVVDRVVCSIAPGLMGAGTDAVGDLGTTRVSEQIRLENRSVFRVGADILVAGDVVPGADRTESSIPAGYVSDEARAV